MTQSVNLIVVLGPTASGKTTVAANLAHQLDTEIISCDSRQVYRQLTIGSGKDLSEYCVDGKKIPFHLINIADAGTHYNVYEYQRDFSNAYRDIQSRGKLPVLCGGTGMYIEAVVEGYKLIEVPFNKELRDNLETLSLPELADMLSHMKRLHANTDTENRNRTIRAIEIESYCLLHPEMNHSFPEILPLLIGIKFDREMRRDRITQRLRQRLESGLIEEVKFLLESGLTPKDLIYYGLEYKFVTRFVTGEISFEVMFSGLNIAIHQFAKRQMTWFRRMESKGMNIQWIDGNLPLHEKIHIIQEKLKRVC